MEGTPGVNGGRRCERASAARHFFVYFDDVGCFELLAASFDVITRHDDT